MEGLTPIGGVHHIKLPVHDLDRSKRFYVHIMGFKYLPKFDHFTKDGTIFAIMLEGTHGGAQLLVELRKNSEQALNQKHWDPITWSVPARKDLEIWREWFHQNNVQVSKVFTGIQGWVLCALDPDEKIVRLYCTESHEWTDDFDVDDFWLRI